MTRSPRSRLAISLSDRSWSFDSMSATMSSTAWTATDCFWHALRMEPRSFWRSNGSRRPSRLTTCGRTSSMYSYVVYLRWHLRQARRRRMNSPSRPTRESTTRSSVWPQKGHFMTRPPRPASALGIERETAGQRLDFSTHRRFHARGSELTEHAVDQVGDDSHLALAHSPGRHGRGAEADATRHHGTS